jgi:transposase
MAKRSGLSKSTVGRIWKAFRLKPHLTEGFKLSGDPSSSRRSGTWWAVPGPARAGAGAVRGREVQVQALDRSQPVLPMMPGMPERRTHDYLRNGVTSRCAALDIATGHVIGSLHRRHRSIEFKKFLATLDQEVPTDLDVHLVCDNYATHKTETIQRWLATRPRFHVHFVPTSSSWLNQVERWFAELTTKLLQRGVHTSVPALEADIRAWSATWNQDPKPFVWTKTAEEILSSLARYCQRISGAGH